jgi:hypothetical protein
MPRWKSLLHLALVFSLLGGAIAATLFVELADLSARRQIADQNPQSERRQAPNKEEWSRQIAAAVHWLTEQKALIDIISTSVIAVFTGFLYVATKRLADLAAGQSSDMQSLLIAARNNSTAAASQATTATKQHATLQEQAQATAEVAKAAARSAEAAEKALFDLEAPYVYVEVISSGFELGPEVEISPEQILNASIPGIVTTKRTEHRPINIGDLEYKLGNYGRTPAFVTERFVHCLVSPSLPPKSDEFGGDRMPHGVILPPQQLDPRVFEWSLEGVLLDESGRQRYPLGFNHLWFWGFVKYHDLFDRHYISGFSFFYLDTERRFVLAGGPEQNYRRRDDAPRKIPT